MLGEMVATLAIEVIVTINCDTSLVQATLLYIRLLSQGGMQWLAMYIHGDIET